jgi:hypothetical protein
MVLEDHPGSRQRAIHHRRTWGDAQITREADRFSDAATIPQRLGREGLEGNVRESEGGGAKSRLPRHAGELVASEQSRWLPQVQRGGGIPGGGKHDRAGQQDKKKDEDGEEEKEKGQAAHQGGR